MQTAVQWLKQQYNERGGTLPSGVFQDALDMEKEQITNALKNHERLLLTSPSYREWWEQNK